MATRTPNPRPTRRAHEHGAGGSVYLTIEDRVAVIVLNRPAVLNCIDEDWLANFHRCLDSLHDHPRVRVVVVRGAGRAFCSGIDLTALANGRVSNRFFRSWEEALRRLETMEHVVIAAVHSHCIGGGLQLALACDLRVARTDARFGITALKEGIIPGLGVWRLTRYAGVGRAKQLALAADVVDAATAQQWGLIEYVAGARAYERTVHAIVERVLAHAETSSRLTKRLANIAHDTAFEEFLDVFTEFQRAATASADHRSAMADRRLRLTAGSRRRRRASRTAREEAAS